MKTAISVFLSIILVGCKQDSINPLEPLFYQVNDGFNLYVKKTNDAIKEMKMDSAAIYYAKAAAYHDVERMINNAINSNQ